ncbi:hypothetical protein IKE82_01700, partial [Candidatus Saccharibacteria bacterium]|nr:hypothetical protein [Candidatus Saccharibacteria bacterium]
MEKKMFDDVRKRIECETEKSNTGTILSIIFATFVITVLVAFVVYLALYSQIKGAEADILHQVQSAKQEVIEAIKHANTETVTVLDSESNSDLVHGREPQPSKDPQPSPTPETNPPSADDRNPTMERDLDPTPSPTPNPNP